MTLIDLRARRAATWAALSVALGPWTAARAIDCLGPATAAFGAGRLDETLAAITAVRGEADCAAMALDLDMLRALALMRIAEAEGGETWCAAREAYAPLRAAPDADYARTAVESFTAADAHCRGEPVQPPAVADAAETPAAACPPVEAGGVSPGWLIGGGLVALSAGGVLLGFGVADGMRAQGLADDLQADDFGSAADAIEQRRAEGRMTGLLVGGGVLAALGAAALVGGLAARTDAEPATPGVRLEGAPGGVRLWGRF